jgi:hypothetical protein
MNIMNTVNTLGKKFSHWRVLVADRNHVTCICRCGTVRIFNADELKELPPSQAWAAELRRLAEAMEGAVAAGDLCQKCE